MRAAIYARRSTEEHQAASLEVQLEEAKRFIASKGWTFDERHVFIEDGVSRAEFKRRPVLFALLNAAHADSFDVVVVRDETRLGGDMYRTGVFIQTLLEAGVHLHYYFTDHRVRMDGAMDKMMVSIGNFSAEFEREKISQRTREHLINKARRGLNAGGRVYGFDNVRVDGEVHFKINDEQAEIVREIFQRRAAGKSCRAIAILLNDRRVPPPRAGKRGTDSWAPSVIRSMTTNPKYIGVFVYGKHQKTYRGGTKVRVRRPDCELIRVELPELAIVDRQLWTSVQPARSADKAPSKAQRHRGAEPKYLLSGLAKCGICAGPIHVVHAKFGSAPALLYVCSWHRNRGAAVCANGVRRPVAVIDDAVIGWIKDNVLREELIIETLHEVRRRLHERAKTAGPELQQLEKQARTLRREIDNLVSALAQTTEKPTIVLDAINDRNRRLKDLEARIEAASMAPSAIDLETRRMEQEARARLIDFRALLERNPTEARRAVEALLEGPLTFTGEGEKGHQRFRIEGLTSAGALFITEDRGPSSTPPNGSNGAGTGGVAEGAQFISGHVPNRTRVDRNEGSSSFITVDVPTGTPAMSEPGLTLAVLIGRIEPKRRRGGPVPAPA